MNLIQVAELVVFRGSFLAELFEAMQSSSWVEEMPILPSEQVVGEMDELEIALNFLRQKNQKRMAEITNSLADGKQLRTKKIVKLRTDYEQCQHRFEIADKLLWENIKRRFGYLGKWGVRDYHKIVCLEPPPKAKK